MRIRLSTFKRLLSEWRQKCGLSPRKVQVDHLITDLGGCTAEMKHACKLVESDFLDIGEHLQTIYQQAIQLTQNARSAVGHIGLDHENNLLSEITRITHRAMTDLEQEKSRIQESRESIQIIGDRLLSIRSMIGGLKQVANTLKVVAININIESSRLAESRELFTVMPQEIQTLSDTMLEVVGMLSEETKVIAANSGAANQAMKRKLERFHELVGDAHTIVNYTTSDVKDLINRSIQTFQRVGNDAHVLSQSVGEIVQNIQIHDNINQRVQHVAEALTDACQNLVDSDESAWAVVLMDGNLELQHSQLKNILSDIDNTYQESTRSFGAIGRTVENIAMSLGDIVSTGVEDRSMKQNMGNSIGSLNGALKKIQKSIHQGVETATELKEIVQETTAVVARISGHMKHMLDVNFDIHIKSLNAIIGSIRLGDEGKSIGVLVEKMKDLAYRSNEIVAQVDKMNTAITNDVSVLRERIEGSDSEGARMAETDRTNLEIGIGEFDAAGAAFIKGVDNVAQSSDCLVKEVHSANEKMRFLKSFADQIRRQLSRLNAFRTQLTPWIDAKSSTVMLDRERLAARYTMQRERDIQATVLAMADPEGAGRNVGTSPGGPEADFEAAIYERDVNAIAGSELGDNVELF